MNDSIDESPIGTVKIIIAGGRDFDDYGLLHGTLHDLFISHGHWRCAVEIVSGAARGADELGERFAEDWSAPVKRFPADWDKHGKAAGPIRNNQMAEYADILVAFWDGKSRGTSHMINSALKHGLEVHVYRYELSDTGKVV